MKSKKSTSYFIALLFLFTFSSCTLFRSDYVSEISTTVINEELVKQHLFFLASDSLKGRNTPSPELDTAASYIARVFKSLGLEPVNGSYFNKVGLSIINLGEKNHLRITKDSKSIEFKIKNDFTPFDITGDAEVNSSIIFAGYGITADEYNYDDYADINVEGKIVFVLRHEPGEEDSTSIFEGKRATKYSDVSEKVKIAMEHGAVGVLVATDPLNHSSLTPRGFPWPSLSRTIPKDALPIVLSKADEKRIPVVHVGEEVINQLFGSVENLKNLQAEIDKNLKPNSFKIENTIVDLKTSIIINNVPTQNVVGFLEGSDPKLKNEIVVIGAHYDHVGYMKQHTEGSDYIYNGADDNASGTTGVLAIATAFSKMPQKPKRSVLFMTFAGEEKGLFGSKSYVDNPLFPLEQTVAMINLDMIGRNGEDSIFIVGSSRSPDLARINNEENVHIGLTLASDEKQIGGSDHMSFYSKKIPFLFYFSGLHEDYHQVTDNPELINLRKLSRVSQLAFRTAWRISNDDKRYSLISK